MKGGDEIDLLTLLAKAIDIFKRNIALLLIAFISGTTLGLIYYQYTQNKYESKMILLSDILTASYGERLTESLNRLVREGNLKTLSGRLGVTPAEAASINKIEIESVKRDKAAGEESLTFIVTAVLSDKNFFPKLQVAIIDYLRNNEFVKIRVRQRKEYYETMIRKLDDEINSLDSLKKRLFLGSVATAKGEMLLVDPSKLYSEIIELNRERINSSHSLELVNSIQLVEGFTLFENPTSPRLSVSMAGGASIGLLVVLVVIIIQSVRKLLQISEDTLGRP